MQKIETDDEGIRIMVEEMHITGCSDCKGNGHIWCGGTARFCRRCDGNGSVWEDDDEVRTAVRCPQCAGIGWVLPRTALERCELCDGMGKIEVTDVDD